MKFLRIVLSLMWAMVLTPEAFGQQTIDKLKIKSELTFLAETPSRVSYIDASGVMRSSTVTNTELGYLSGVTSAIQTQIDGKQATITGAASSMTTADFIANKVMITDGLGKADVSSITASELSNLSGISSNVQTQLNGKQATITGGATSITTADLATSKALVSDGSGKVAASSVTSTELGYLSGVTSAIQTQINTNATNIATKATDTAVVHNTGNESVAGNKTFTDKIVATSTSKASRPCPEMTQTQRDAVTSIDNGACIYNTTSKKLNVYDSGTSTWSEAGGSGQGGINYIGSNYNAEQSVTTGWNCYSDGASATPVDGTGGTPGGFAITNEANTSLEGARLFRLTKTSGASRQGEGCSFDFTIDAAYKAKTLRIVMPYTSSTNLIDTDLRAYIYDVTNSRIIEVDNRDISANTFGHFIASFQASSDSTSYRLIFHNANTTTHTNGWTFDFDTVTVAPQTLVKGPTLTDPREYTPTIAGGTVNSGTVKFTYTQIGKWYYVTGTFEMTTPSGATFYITLPGGVSADTATGNGLAFFGTKARLDGQMTHTSAGGGNGLWTLGTGYSPFIDSSDPTKIFFTDVNTTDAGSTVLGGGAVGTGIFNSGGQASVSFWVPISGKSSSMALSEDGGTRKVVAKLTLSANQTVSSSSATQVQLNTVTTDTTGSHNTSTYTYTIPESGFYTFYPNIISDNLTSGQSHYVYLRKNGSDIATLATAVGSGVLSGGGTPVGVECVKGDTITVYVQSGGDTSYIVVAASSSFSVVKESTPQTLSGGEAVAARAIQTSGQTLLNNTTTTITWDSSTTFNTHGTGVFSPTTGVFTASSSGYYGMKCYITTASVAWTAVTHQIDMYIYKNGILHTREFYPAESSVTNNKSAQINDTVYLAKGDTMDCRSGIARGASTSLYTGNLNYITITKRN